MVVLCFSSVRFFVIDFAMAGRGGGQGKGVVGDGGNVRDTRENVEREQSNVLGEVNVRFGVEVFDVGGGVADAYWKTGGR